MTSPSSHGPRHWRLHVGAHKTATTHLQAQLEALRPELEAAEIGLATLEQLRPARALDLRPRRPKVWLGRGVLRREITARIGARVTLMPRMVLSEEDILGNAAAPLHPTLYPRAGFRLRALASALLRNGQGGIWLSVRSLDRFIPAAYATALKHGVLPVDSETLKQRILTNPPAWSDLVTRLSRAAPGVQITVWDYAEYRANSAAIIADLTGYTPHEMPILPDPVVTQTPDAEAIKAAEALPHDLDPRTRAARLGALYEAATGPRFSMFTPDQAEALQAQHRAELELIHALPQVRVLSF